MIQPFLLVRLDGYDRNAKLPAETLGVDADALRPGDIDHVERQHDRNAQFQSLRGEIQVAFQVGRIDDRDDDIGPGFALLPAQDDIDSHHLIGTARRQTVGARQVDQIERLTGAIQLAFLELDGDAGVVADVLRRPVRALNRVVLPVLGLPTRAAVSFLTGIGSTEASVAEEFDGPACRVSITHHSPRSSLARFG